jgi:hypothetical protein
MHPYGMKVSIQKAGQLRKERDPLRKSPGRCIQVNVSPWGFRSRKALLSGHGLVAACWLRRRILAGIDCVSARETLAFPAWEDIGGSWDQKELSGAHENQSGQQGRRRFHPNVKESHKRIALFSKSSRAFRSLVSCSSVPCFL